MKFEWTKPGTYFELSQVKKEIYTTFLGDKYNNIKSIWNIFVYGPLYQSIAVFMYQNECAINIFFI